MSKVAESKLSQCDVMLCWLQEWFFNESPLSSPWDAGEGRPWLCHLLQGPPSSPETSGEQGFVGNSSPPPCGTWEFPMYPADRTAPTTHKLHLGAQVTSGEFSLNPKILYGHRLLVKQWTPLGLNRKMPVKILPKCSEELSNFYNFESWRKGDF